MDIKRINEILHQDKISEIYYNNQSIWVQEFHDNIAKIGFLNNSKEKNVHIKDLYE